MEHNAKSKTIHIPTGSQSKEPSKHQRAATAIHIAMKLSSLFVLIFAADAVAIAVAADAEQDAFEKVDEMVRSKENPTKRADRDRSPGSWGGAVTSRYLTSNFSNL